MLEDYPIAELRDYIDWSPFFATWELTGKFPAILDDAKYGPAARSLFDDAQAMLDRIASERWFRASAVFGFWPANADGDDILVYGDERRAKPIAVLHTLRQQLTRREGRANVALADFVAPRASALADHVGAFMVTAGIGEDEVAERFKRANDDYSAIMVKALADRLAEAFAERLHQRVRKEFWAYAPDEALGSAELIAEKYRGIRPAPGYPAQPDHSEKATLFALLDGERRIGVKLTESFAMWPGASVCGLYFSHPESHYFGVGKIERDQVEDYAAPQGLERGRSGEMARAGAQLRSAHRRAHGGGVTARSLVSGQDAGSLPSMCDGARLFRLRLFADVATRTGRWVDQGSALDARAPSQPQYHKGAVNDVLELHLGMAVGAWRQLDRDLRDAESVDVEPMERLEKEGVAGRFHRLEKVRRYAVEPVQAERVGAILR